MNSIQNNGMMNYQLGFKAKIIKPENCKFVTENVRDMKKLGGLNYVPEETIKKLAEEARSYIEKNPDDIKIRKMLAEIEQLMKNGDKIEFIGTIRH